MFEPGDEVIYYDYNDGTERPGIIISVDINENGVITYAVDLIDGKEDANRWGYEDQFTKRA